MKSIPIKAFLSCSFQDEDREIVSFVSDLCEGLDIKCFNVSDGYTRPPQEVARDQIDEADLLIAIASKRDQKENGKFYMPQAVNNEISIAYGQKTPILILKERNVIVEGFNDKYATFLEFSRDSIKESDTLKRLISSIHAAKLDVVSSHDLIPDQQDSSGFYQEYLHALYELTELEDGYTWKYWTTRKLVFTKAFSGRITNGAWATIPRRIKDAESIKYSIKQIEGSKSFKIEVEEMENSPEVVETSTRISPKPEKNDWIILQHYYESPFLNRIKCEPENKKIMVGEAECDCVDGVVPIVRTKHLKFQLRFPSSYGLRKADLTPLVGSYSARIDYLVESEVDRVKWHVEDFGGNVVGNFDIQSPLLRHVYGFYWNAPEKHRLNQTP